MNCLISLSLLLLGFYGCMSETFFGNAADLTQLQQQQALSYQYSNLILEFQALNAFMNGVHLWNRHYAGSHKEVFQARNLEDDSDFSLEEDSTPKNKDLEMFGPMSGTYGYGYPTQQVPPVEGGSALKAVESQMEFSFLTYLKYLGIITARKLETASYTHYQSRLITSTLQSTVATNPMASSLLYMLYFRDVLQTLQLSQAIQRHDIWTFWNTVEILETIETGERNAPKDLREVIKRAYAISMRVYATEAMYDFQTLMIDYYISPILAQIAASAQPVAAPAPQTTQTAFVEEEVEAQPEKPFFPMMMMGMAGMGGPQYMQYYVMMLKFYTKYILLSATQTLATEGGHRLIKEKNDALRNSLTTMRLQGIGMLTNWCQMKYFLLYLDWYLVFAAPGAAPLQSTDGPAHATANLVQTESQVEPRLNNPVIESQPVAPAVVPQHPAPQAPRQSVVG